MTKEAKAPSGKKKPVSGAGKSKPGVLARGSSGDAVSALQDAVNAWGYGLEVDGKFGGETEAAVRHFQTYADLAVDGLVGPATRDALADGVDSSVANDYEEEEWLIVLKSEPPYVVYAYEYEYVVDEDDEDEDEDDEDEDEDEADDEDDEDDDEEDEGEKEAE
jgi:peptidoglycan hydrolase-like protein with peptidoglycan-binding domain